VLACFSSIGTIVRAHSNYFNMKKNILTALLLIGVSLTSIAQNVGINATGANPDASAMLDVSATNTGMLIPRVALTARNVAAPVVSPALSLLVYNTATAGTSPNNVTPGFHYWTGTAWVPLLTGGTTTGGWNLAGNTGTDAAINFMGTTDDKAVTFKSNNANYLQMGSRQTLGLVQSFPDYTDGTERVALLYSALQFDAPAAQFYKPKLFTDANGNFRMKGSSAGTDFFEFGATGTDNGGGLEFVVGDDGDEPIVFKSYNFTGPTTTEIMRMQNSNVAIGSSTFDATNPEKFLVNTGTTSSVNAMYAKGNINNYLQFNLQNQSAGANASSDIVATANNGSEITNYVNMGINSGAYTGNVMGGANDAYLYNVGQDMLIGTGTAGKVLALMTGGTDQATNERMRIDGTGNVGIGTTAPAAKLDVAGTVKVGTAGTVLNNIIKTNFTINDNTNFAENTTRSITVTVTGATVNASVIVNPRTALSNGIAIAWARVTAANTIQIAFVNSGTTNRNIGNTTFDVTIIQ
jgi:hypothetical protein